MHHEGAAGRAKPVGCAEERGASGSGRVRARVEGPWREDLCAEAVGGSVGRGVPGEWTGQPDREPVRGGPEREAKCVGMHVWSEEDLNGAR